MDHIVVDVEIQKTIEELPNGWDSTDLMGVACACVWEHRTGRMGVYGPDDVKDLQKRLLVADRITGFNILNFDFPVIWGVKKSDWIQLKKGKQADTKYRLMIRSNDLLRRIWLSLDLDPDVFNPRTHGGWSLDNVARETLGGVCKIGNGADAPKWYQKGGAWHYRLVNYCADDVAIERDLADFVDRYGYVLNPHKTRLVITADHGR